MTGGPFRALDFVFRIDADDAGVGRRLDLLLEALVDGAATGPARYRVDGPGGDGRYHLAFEGTALGSFDEPDGVLALLMWDANRRAVAASTTALLVHAASVDHRSGAVVMPGPSGSGKTVLAARLVRSGLSYLGDEVAVIDPLSGELRPYPRPLGLDGVSPHLLAELLWSPGAHPPRPGLVAPADVRPHSIGGASRPAWVVLPRYRPGPTTVTPVAGAEAVAALGAHTFNLDGHGQRGLDALVAVIEASTVLRVAYGDGGDAAETIIGLLGGDPPPAPPFPEGGHGPPLASTDPAHIAFPAQAVVRRQPAPMARVGAEAVVYDRSSQRLHVLNATARDVWQWCDGTCTADEVVTRAVAEYGAHPATVRREVGALLSHLLGLGLVGAGEGSGPAS